MDSTDIFGTQCAHLKRSYREIDCMQLTEENGAKLFRRLNACASRHIGAPDAHLNTRYLVYH